jgi:hypothetical protein
MAEKTKLCECGCGQEVYPGRRYIRGHHLRGKNFFKKTSVLCGCGCGEKANEGRKFIQNHTWRGRPVREDTKEKMSKLLKGRTLSEETKRKMSNSLIKHGEGALRTKHSAYKEQKCVFGCESNYYELHHEPRITKENAKEWEGKLVNVCKSCHNKIHHGSLTVPENFGIIWTLEQTKETL